ncbi:MAG: DUF4386 family protein [Gammaproteobacteria bacterium]|nr:DUF4386 family protein [Gammaproteobacteria bacterium]
MTSINKTLATSMAIFSGLMLAAYFGLVTYFQFPDVLRLPTTEMMEIFIANQMKIVGFYYLFVLSQIAFISVVLIMHHYLSKETSVYLTLATGFGILAGLCQALGFARWPFLVPYLAGIVQDPASTEVMRETALIVFQSFHNFAGIAVGENIFFVLEGLWAVSLSVHLYTKHTMSTRLITVPALSGVAILIYSLEQFGGAMAALGPLNVIAHAALVFWFIALSVTLFTRETAIDADTRLNPITTAIIWIAYLAIVVPGFITN